MVGFRGRFCGRAVTTVVVSRGRWFSGDTFDDVRGSCSRRIHSCILLMVVVLVMMVMQGRLQHRVERHHPEVLGQPAVAYPHVRTMSAKA